MQKQYRISAGQLFSILFVNRSVIMLTHNTLLGGGENMVDNILSALLALVLNFVLILPLYFLHRRNPQENVLETGERLVGKPGAILLAVFYGLYFMAIDSYYLSFFQIFLNNIMEPLMPVWLVALAFVAVVCYAAYLGIEAIARTAGFALAIILIGMVWIGVALLPKIQWINYDPFLYNGPKQLFTGTALFLARSTGFSTMALLLPRVSGKKKLKFCIWNTGIYCLMIFLLLGMVGVGGSGCGRFGTPRRGLYYDLGRRALYPNVHRRLSIYDLPAQSRQQKDKPYCFARGLLVGGGPSRSGDVFLAPAKGLLWRSSPVYNHHHGGCGDSARPADCRSDSQEKARP